MKTCAERLALESSSSVRDPLTAFTRNLIGPFTRNFIGRRFAQAQSVDGDNPRIDSAKLGSEVRAMKS